MRPPSRPRSPWQTLYGAAHRARERYWRRHARSLPRPVVSVGNLLWGGSGKTPLVAALAAWLRDRGLRPAILSRGYGGRGRGVRVVSLGDGPLLPPRAAGDEPVLLAELVPGVPILVNRDRLAAGRHALGALPEPPGLFILDDGFSHLRLRRDLDILALPARDPFGGGRLLPGGRLREPLAASHRAHAVVLTAGRAGDPPGAELARWLRPFGFLGPGFDAPGAAGPIHFDDGRSVAPGTPVLAVAAVARPEAVFDAIAACGATIVDRLALRDHDPYGDATLTAVRRAFAASGAAVVVTSGKDAVKLRRRLDLPLAVVAWRLEPEPRFWTWLDAELAGLLDPRAIAPARPPRP